jgi:hypothetical protein
LKKLREQALKEETFLKEKIKILEKEIATLTEKLDGMTRDLR